MIARRVLRFHTESPFLFMLSCFVGLYLLLVALRVYSADLPLAQTPSNGINWTAVGIVVAGVAIIAFVLFYFLWWKPQHPAAAAVIEAQATAAGTTVSADMQALVGTVQELLSHMRDTAAANAASVAPPGGDGVPGVVIVKVGGTASTDIPALIAAYFAAGAKAKAKR